MPPTQFMHDSSVQSRAETVDVFALEAKEHEGNSSPIPLGTALLIGAICVVVFAAVAVLFYMAVAMRRNPTTSHQDPKKTDRGVDSNSDAGTDAFDQDAAAIQTVYDTERASALRSLSGGSRIEETGGGLLPALTTKEALPADPAESGQALDDDRNCCSVDIVEAKEPSCDYHAALGAFTSPPDHNVKMPADDSSAGDPTGHAYRTRTVTM